MAAGEMPAWDAGRRRPSDRPDAAHGLRIALPCDAHPGTDAHLEILVTRHGGTSSSPPVPSHGDPGELRSLPMDRESGSSSPFALCGRAGATVGLGGGPRL